MITQSYKELNEALHKRDDYGAGGSRHKGQAEKLYRMFRCNSALDYGAGKRTLSKVVSFDMVDYDPCVPEISALPLQADFVTCTDVMEHIEPQMLDQVLSHIRDLTIKVAYFCIATRPDRSKLLPDGTNPHKIIESAGWWEREVNKYFEVLKVESNGSEVRIICV